MSRLERWSRRKRGEGLTTDEAVIPPADESLARDRPADPEEALDSGSSMPSGTDPEPGSLDDSLPDPETLPPGSDIKAFLEPGVSAGLRRRALRRLFSGDKYGIRDGLDDYDHDYREKLKPLASELAQRLRKWSQPVEEEALDQGETRVVSGPEHAPSADEAPPEETPGDVADEAMADPGKPALDQGRVGTNRQNSQE